MRLERAVAVLQVSDVGRSIDWYAARLGFDADPFPKNPPYGFAMLRRDGAELMLQAGTSARPADAKEEGAGDGLLELAGSVRRTTPLVRGPERMFYGLVEFEVIDPDGYRICVSGSVPAGADVPAARE